MALRNQPPGIGDPSLCGCLIGRCQTQQRLQKHGQIICHRAIGPVARQSVKRLLRILGCPNFLQNLEIGRDFTQKV